MVYDSEVEQYTVMYNDMLRKLWAGGSNRIAQTGASAIPEIQSEEVTTTNLVTPILPGSPYSCPMT